MMPGPCNSRKKAMNNIDLNIIWRENMPNNLMLNSLYIDFTEIRVQIWRKFNIKIDEMHLTWGYNKTPTPCMPGIPKFRLSPRPTDTQNPCIWARMQAADTTSDWLYCYDSKLPAHELCTKYYRKNALRRQAS